MRFTALLDVSTYDNVNNVRMALKGALPHLSLTQRALVILEHRRLPENWTMLLSSSGALQAILVAVTQLVL